MTSPWQPAGVRAQAALAHLAGPIVALAVAVGFGRPVIWAGMAASAGSAIAFLLVRRRARFVAAHAGEALNAHLSIAAYLCAAAVLALAADRFAARADPAVLVASSERARSLLGWTPEHALDDIVASAWRWHQRRWRVDG